MSRDAEMGWILAKLKRPEPAAFVLAGAPGVGKTRLAAAGHAAALATGSAKDLEAAGHALEALGV